MLSVLFLGETVDSLVLASIFCLIIGIICSIGLWKIFEKAGKPGWMGLIPIYNIFILLKITGKPGWWTIIFFIPLVDTLAYITVMITLGNCFRKSLRFKFGLIFLPYIFEFILGYDKSRYTAPKINE